LQRCSIDDDDSSFKVTDEGCKQEAMKEITTITSTNTKANEVDGPIDNNKKTTNDQQDNMEANAAMLQAPAFDLSKRLSCKWASGYGPRIGCVRDYPADLQSRALEQVKLSPRINPGLAGSCVPIPSPRPSPKVRVSPRLAYMGLPSPRVAVSTSQRVWISPNGELPWSMVVMFFWIFWSAKLLALKCSRGLETLLVPVQSVSRGGIFRW